MMKGMTRSVQAQRFHRGLVWASPRRGDRHLAGSGCPVGGAPFHPSRSGLAAILLFSLFTFNYSLFASTPDSLQVMAVSDQVWTHLPNEPRKGLPLAYRSLQLSHASGNPWLLANGYNDVASCFLFTGAYDTALIYLDSCLALREQLQDEKGKAATHNKKGIAFTNQGLLEEAIHETELSLSYYQRIQDTVRIGKLLDNLAVLHWDMHDYGRSVRLGQEALKYAQAAGDTLTVAKSILNLGNAFIDLGEMDKGMQFLDSALVLMTQLDAQADVAIIHHNKGATYVDLQDYPRAETHLLQALDIARRGNYQGEELSAMVVLGELYQKTGNHPAALALLRRALSLGQEMGAQKELRTAYKHLAALYENQGRWDSAYHYQMERQRLTEQIFDESSAQALRRAQVRYQVHQKESENALLKKDLQLQAEQLKASTAQGIALGAALLAVAFLAIILVLRLRNRQKARVLSLQQANIAALIQGEQQERSRLARELHDGLGQLLSTARIQVAALEGEVPEEEQAFVTNAIGMIDKAVTEVRNVSHNLMPDALQRQGLKAALEGMVTDINRATGPTLHLEMAEAPQALDAQKNFALYRLLQELVTNAIRHAAASKIWICQIPSTTGYVLEVGDNGKGFDPQAAQGAPGTGIGSQNIAARIHFLGGVLETQSQPGHGSRFIIRLP
jgi:two-component system, NarL family, sensor kinase